MIEMRQKHTEFLQKKKKANLQDPNRKTTKKDISTIGDILKLTQEEKDFSSR